jgi:hypothetical protein
VPKAITHSTLALAITIVGGWLWVTTYFVTQERADAVHELINRRTTEIYLDMTVRNAQRELEILDAKGVLTPADIRRYELLEFEVRHKTLALEDY